MNDWFATFRDAANAAAYASNVCGETGRATLENSVLDHDERDYLLFDLTVMELLVEETVEAKEALHPMTNSTIHIRRSEQTQNKRREDKGGKAEAREEKRGGKKRKARK